MITTCATFAAIVLFVAIGSQVLPWALNAEAVTGYNGLEVAFLLNVAIIIFGWRRSRDLKDVLAAHDAAERAAEEAAYADFTTGLANRRQLMRCLEDRIEERQGGTLALLDLDDFKKVNDLHGHFAGDELLKLVADTLTAAAPEGSCCARTGGDEFAILLSISETDAIEQFAKALLKRLSEPFAVDGIPVRISASLGLAKLSRRLTAVGTLRHADVAMYAAKRAGRNRYSWFDTKLEREVRERAQLEVDIRQGIENGEFVPYFQPLIRLDNGALVGFEVLARWNSPSRGFLEPRHFISMAEETASIAALSLSVMEQALIEGRNWPSHLKLAVNISPVQFRDPLLANRIVQILSRTGFPSGRLELEITESSLLEDPQVVLTTVESLRNLGISISLDDFGTGYASLTQLKTLPFDRIKIDQSFVGSLDADHQSAAIVGSISALGKSLSVPVTAEGVESESVRGQLSDLGCNEAQGWLFGRAVSAQAVSQMLAIDPKPTITRETRSGPTDLKRAAGL